MPVEIETFGDTIQRASVEAETFGVIEGFDPSKIYVFCDPQDQGGVILPIQVVQVEGEVGYDMQLYADDDDLTGKALDPTAPVEFSGSVTIGIASKTIGRIVLLKHVRSQGPEPEEALPVPTATVR